MSLNNHMAAIYPSSVSLVLVARISGILIAALVLSWALLFKSSFLPHSPFSSQEDPIFAVLHPLLMVIGFILISGEAILIHRWLPGSRNLKKSVHLCLQGVALGCGIFGIWTKFHGQEGIVANFFSLHSWMGLICICLFGAQETELSSQFTKLFFFLLLAGLNAFNYYTLTIILLCLEWMVGFISFWHRGEVRSTRAKVLPWHIFLGLYTYGLAVITAETGLLEKLTFLQSRRNESKHCPESMIVNSLGLGLVLLCGIVILTAVSPKHNAVQSKLMYSSDTKCLSS